MACHQGCVIVEIVTPEDEGSINVAGTANDRLSLSVLCVVIFGFFVNLSRTIAN